MSFTLSDGTTTITLYPKWDNKHDRKMSRSDHRMNDASLFSYRWAAYDSISMSIDGLSPADASQINTWWENRTKLLYDTGFLGTTHTLYVTVGGNSTPFPKFWAPRVDYYQGKLTLDAMYPSGLYAFLLVDHAGDYIVNEDGDNIGVISR